MSKTRKRTRATKPPKPIVFTRWGTMAEQLKEPPSVCLWGERQSAEEGCDYDERVCLVRVEVLKVVERRTKELARKC